MDIIIAFIFGVGVSLFIILVIMKSAQQNITRRLDCLTLWLRELDNKLKEKEPEKVGKVEKPVEQQPAEIAEQAPVILAVPVIQPAEPADYPFVSARHTEFDSEYELSTRFYIWITWIGSIALAMAGGFLVKYWIDRGLIQPMIRVGLGLFFCCALLGLGEWLRTRSARISQGLTAAGISVLYASLLAALILYNMVGTVTGFVLMALITAAAVILSLRHGPFVALLSMIGGFLTPYLVRMGVSHPAPIFAYLLMLQIGAMIVVRIRKWRIIGGLTLYGGIMWR